MPISNRVGDIFVEDDINVIAHQANLFHTFGGGIARVIRDKYPEAYDADLATPKGDPADITACGKLGTYSTAKAPDGRIIVNCYSQTGMGAKDRNTSYNDIVTIFAMLEAKIAVYNKANPGNERIIGVPYGYGSNLAGGRWPVVEAIFKSIFENSPVKLVIVRLPGQADLL